MYDILTIGDATIDVFLNLNDAEVRCELDTDNCKICFRYADKIPVESVTRVLGAGNASNNAVGASRLDMSAAIVSILGNDETGRLILEHWNDEGVNTKHVTFDKKRGTNYSTVLNFRGERTILVYHEERDYDFPAKVGPAKWIYYTSLGKGSEILHDRLLKCVKTCGARLVFQPGTFQLKLGKEKLRPLLAAAEIVVMNKEEAERLLGDGRKSVEKLLAELRKFGCRIAIITDGQKGSYACDGIDTLYLPIFDVPVVERTGCGDAFATAFVASLHHGENLGEAMRWGTANSASVLGYIGPQQGLLTLGEMKKWLKRFAKIQPRKL